MDYSIPAVVLARPDNVFLHVLEGRPVWVKKRRRRSALLRRGQRLLHALTGATLLLTPDDPPTDNVLFETERLRRAAALGLRVPAVLHQAEEYFVVESAGLHLDGHVKKYPEERGRIIDLAAAELGRMHSLGVVHGGAQIKNITVRDGEICFIDLEENIPEDRLEEFKLRDLFLFLFSLEKTGNDPDLRRICGVYGGERGEEVLRDIARAARPLRALRRIVNCRPVRGLLAGRSLRDIRPVCSLADRIDREFS